MQGPQAEPAFASAAVGPALEVAADVVMEQATPAPTWIEREPIHQPLAAPPSVQAPVEPLARPAALPASSPSVAPTPAQSHPPLAAQARFELPIDDLRALAQTAGLEWVNSDAERILVVQQAMANEPKPAHVPRVPRPRVIIDDGPLVLVETRKDLSQMKLPFEQQQRPPSA